MTLIPRQKSEEEAANKTRKRNEAAEVMIKMGMSIMTDNIDNIKMRKRLL